MFSLESPQRGDSNEYTQYTISQYEKENHPKLSQMCSNGICSKGLKNEFETAVVNKPSVFELLKFYCNSTCISNGMPFYNFPFRNRVPSVILKQLKTVYKPWYK